VSVKFGRHGQDGPETSPSTNGERGKKARAAFNGRFRELQPEYDLSLNLSKVPTKKRGGKILRSLEICGATADDTELEVFIAPEAETTARDYINENYPGGYIFRHTEPGAHGNHDWRQADEWIKSNLPDLPQFNCGRGKEHSHLWPDINVSFVMAREATHRVLSSSVFVHACDAMGSVMDAVHYGVTNPHGLPMDPSRIKTMRGFHATQK
jgi:hypothetical protein